MEKIYSLLIITFFIINPFSTEAQESSANRGFDSRMTGEWTVSDHKIEMNRESEFHVDAENSMFADIIKGASRLKIQADGTFTFYREGSRRTGFLKVNGNQIFFNYVENMDAMGKSEGKRESVQNAEASAGSVSTTIYEFSMSGNSFTIKRSDPLLSEQYVFSK